MEINEKQITKFPKGFFNKERPKVSLKESLKDVIPVEWASIKTTSNEKSKSLNNMSIIANIK